MKRTFILSQQSRKYAHSVAWTKKEYEIVKKMVEDGKSDRDIARKLFRTEQAVKTARKRLGLRKPTRRKPHIWTTQEVRELRELIRSGLSDEEIAEKFGLPKKVVASKRRNIGILRSKHIRH